MAHDLLGSLVVLYRAGNYNYTGYCTGPTGNFIMLACLHGTYSEPDRVGTNFMGILHGWHMAHWELYRDGTAPPGNSVGMVGDPLGIFKGWYKPHLELY
eukprot:2796397-Pyramimonas_sp.AAC.1